VAASAGRAANPGGRPNARRLRARKAPTDSRGRRAHDIPSSPPAEPQGWWPCAPVRHPDPSMLASCPPFPLMLPRRGLAIRLNRTLTSGSSGLGVLRHLKECSTTSMLSWHRGSRTLLPERRVVRSGSALLPFGTFSRTDIALKGAVTVQRSRGPRRESLCRDLGGPVSRRPRSPRAAGGRLPPPSGEDRLGKY
jgi:hypothetical protein